MVALLEERVIHLQLLQVRVIMAVAAGRQAHPMGLVVVVVRALLADLVTVEQAVSVRLVQ
jgi:hypothetical protein